MKINFRLESTEDHYAVEALTREAFWKFWEAERTICDEHLLVHRLRTVSSFIPELNIVAEFEGRIVGHIIYTKSKIVDDAEHEYETLTFGPLSVLPEYQNMGIGKALMLHSFDKAKTLGYRAVIIFGHPDYYPRVGFQRAAEFGITTADGNTFDPFMVYPLYDNALDGVFGRYHIDPLYEQLTQEDALNFDKQFPLKEPFVPTSINLLLDRLKPDAKKALESINCPTLEMMTSKSEQEISNLVGIDENAIETIHHVLRKHGIKWGNSKTK